MIIDYLHLSTTDTFTLDVLFNLLDIYVLHCGTLCMLVVRWLDCTVMFGRQRVDLQAQRSKLSASLFPLHILDSTFIIRS
jgi:hypothetical protein